MAYNDDQNPTNLPAGKPEKRKSADHLPRYFRTQVNNKFLSSTIDQLIQPGIAEKLNGYFGQKEAKGYQKDDFYVGDVSKSREDYQFEPSVVIKDDLNNINFYADYNDYINQLRSLGSSVKDHSLLNRQEYYAWNPNIDWDKFVNFREYYWLPNGPRPVQIAGEKDNVVKTIKVTAVDNGEHYGYVFTPDGLTQNPVLTLFRGIKYIFEIDAPGNPLSFRTRKDTAPIFKPNVLYLVGDKVNYQGGIYICTNEHVANDTLNLDFWDLDTTFNLKNSVSQQSVESGTIEVELAADTPDLIYYMSDNDLFASGTINVLDIVEATSIDVEQEILGTKTYTSESGVELSNGMKLEFVGKVTPEKYGEGFWYVEGVGDKIVLMSETDLNVPSSYTTDLAVDFDVEGFDELPFSEAIGYPVNKDYITINRASQDGNLWSKYNRWFHKTVIEKSAEINKQPIDLDQTSRATRPIIEFEANLKLFNYGTQIKKSVDVVDNFTTDVFSTVEGSQGYNIDDVDLTNGMRVLFTADTDPLVTGKIFEVQFINFRNTRQITLKETDDTKPLENEVLLCKQGTIFKGNMLWFDGSVWKTAQQKTTLNQQPLFDAFDVRGYSYSDKEYFDSSTFTGTELFSYKRGNANTDVELGFPLSYRSIENVGDIVFKCNFLQDTVSYAIDNQLPRSVNISEGYIRKYTDRNTWEVLNGWTTAKRLSSQPVIRQYVNDNTRTFYTVDVYENSALLDDLWLRVYLNNSLKFKDIDYTTSQDANSNLTIKFNRPLEIGDNIIIKTNSVAEKTENGKYEIASNLEKNPLNKNINEFTLGEVNDHVSTIVEELDNFAGAFPGTSNLRDLGPLSQYGKRIVKHSAPLNIPMYHIVNREANVIKALKFARREYGKFKRSFIQIATSLGFSGPVKKHVDAILNEMAKDKVSTMPYYFSDMVPFTGAVRSTTEIFDPDNNFFALNRVFDIDSLSDTAVQVYLNETQLVYGKDYTFNNQGFVIVTATKAQGDVLDIYEYETTNGSYIPPTPTKLGLYPKYEPQLMTDDTYLEPQTVIQGHDGSITIAYGDFRDDLLLELEKRIFNNIKIKYDPKVFCIEDYVPGYSRETGLTEQQINDSTISDFVQWLQLVDDDYTKNPSYLRENQFTFNHTGMVDVGENPVHGYWRAVYKYAYDTDRPHTHPWEMLGFTIKPSWWDKQYGEAPYTSNNLLMWEDIEAGMIRDPSTSGVIYKKYARKFITTHIPVDEDGNLVSPILSSFIKSYNTTDLDANFEFGDHSPVETAWRRSSEYPFSLITSIVLNQPARAFATIFDRQRQFRGTSNQINYAKNNTNINLDDIVFPNSVNEETRIYSAGLINYVFDYISASVELPFKEYKNNLKSINNLISFKVGGYTNKDKFKLILDSRTPTNKGNVFIPEENYKIALNTSAPVKNITYSGVIVEKQSNGFIVKGYDRETPYFNINRAIPLQNDPVIRIGGITASFVNWDQEKTYTTGLIVEHQNSYYRVLESHKSGTQFDESKFAKIPELPTEGGREAYFRKAFKNNVERVPYGTVLDSIQDVVDFLLSYGHYLEAEGFVFDFYSPESEFISNWETSAKEFMFWSTQNWGAGSVITLSPGAFKIKFKSEYAIVDDIYDTFYGYSILKADGKKLKPQNVSLTRENPQEFCVRPKATEDGIFAVRLSLVQKEHVVIIDNKTVFGDIIYDQEPGYRQQRIKVLGYRTGNWDGSLNIPGFIFDNATISEWEPWKDYAIGEIVKYKEFYYSSINKVPGTENFESRNWSLLKDSPEMKLIPNFEYKVNQFADFYDLDTDNFDTEQQKFAQHLIGYQNRDYLANIINDDVSQYKFYQGMIQDKGTKNALTKLFDVLGSADKDSLEFYEEWAIKAGQYGAAEGFDEVEFILDESKFKLQPQSVELVNSTTGDETDLVYRIKPFEVFLRPEGYDHKPFPTKYVKETFIKNSGYVNNEDVQFVIDEYDSIANIEYSEIRHKDFVWVGNVGQDWNVYTFLQEEIRLEAVLEDGDTRQLQFATIPNGLTVGEIIGVEYKNDEGQDIAIFTKVTKILNNIVTIDNAEISESATVTNDIISKFVSVRVDGYEAASDLIQNYKQGISRLWIDEDASERWRVIETREGFNQHQVIENSDTGVDQGYGYALAANENNTLLCIGAPNNGDGKVFVFVRAGSSGSFQLNQVVEPLDNLADPGQEFGRSIAVSTDGRYLIVGSPKASNVKSTYKNDYVEESNYDSGAIVEYKNNLWKANKDIDGAVNAITFGSFESVPQIMVDLLQTEEDDNVRPVLLTGDYPFTSDEVQSDFFTDHYIIKAPKDMYEGSGIGDSIKLKWNTLTYANQNSVTPVVVTPFGGEIPELSETFITGKHVIAEKIDSILYVENSNTIPLVGQIVETLTGFGTVAYTFNFGAKATVYIKDQNGTFGTVGSLTTSIGEFVGEYVTVAPDDTQANADDYWGGYWRINTGTYIVPNSTNADVARGLVFVDVTPTTAVGGDQDRFYYNNLDYPNSIINSRDTSYNQLITLSYRGSPGPLGVVGNFESPLFVFKAPKPLTDELSSEIITEGDPANPTLNVFYNSMPPFLTGDLEDRDLTKIGLSPGQVNKQHTVYDIWDGWIDFRITKQFAGDPLEPKVGITVRDVTNLGTAEVVFYQKYDTNNARIFVKNVTGTWALGSNFNENREIEFLSDGSGDVIYDPISGSRVFGQIFERSFEYAPDNIGKFVVVSNGDPIPVQDVDADVATREDTITNGEYWFYREENVLGIPRSANKPTIDNNDWDIVYNVPAEIGGSVPETPTSEEGLFSVYERRGIGSFVNINSFIVPDRQSNRRLGTQIRISRQGDNDKLFVSAQGDNSTTNFGKLYIYKNGTFDGVTYGWESSRNKAYRGPYDNQTLYFADELVFYNQELYRAITTTGPSAFVASDWELITDGAVSDYLGFLPNDTGNIVGDQAAVVDTDNLLKFAKAFDVSKNGEVLVVTTEYDGENSNTIEVYRNVNDSFYKYQTIEAPNKNTNFGNNIAVSNDGHLIAAGAPYDDTEQLDQGRVYLYRNESGSFILKQNLYSPAKEKTELFGWSVDFDGERLLVGSRNGDSFITTTFDGEEVGNTTPVTTFDNKMTEFKSFGKDTGTIRVYEKFDETLLYSQTVDYDVPNVKFFGENVLLKNNHIYVGLPILNTNTKQGVVVDYRLKDNTTIWNTLRSSKDTVDVNKIKRAMIYDKSKNEIITYIDYIDVLQGKIAGPAEQELTYKTYYDPASYTTGTQPNTDATNSWSSLQVGQLWWDLTGAKFRNPYQSDVIFSSNNWNSKFADINTINVYEWVKSDLLPSEWDEISGTTEGVARGITGKTKLGDDGYVVKREYNEAVGVFNTYYYYWVGNKTTLPPVEGRTITGRDVAALIENPAAEGYRFISLITDNQFAVHNCEGFVRDNDIVLSLQYWTIDNQDTNIHNQYQIITEGLETSIPSRDIQRKWFDSLVGSDEQNRQVPAPELSAKEKYGILNRPRQGWFVNREEALKQVVTRVNSVLAKNLIVDDKDITPLTESQPEPTKESKRWDRSVDALIDLQFVGVAKAEQAVITPVIEDGKIIRVEITNTGRGYLQAPTISVFGTGSDAELTSVIDNQGRVTEVIVNNQGTNYSSETRLTVRRYTVLVKNDTSLNGKWSLYERDTVAKEWILVESQAYDVSLYWNYTDWYAEGYNSFTKIDYVIDFSYNLTTLDDVIGNIIKIQNVGSGGWLLLEKIDAQTGVDYSVNYKTIGRQNGTIQIRPTLYDVQAALVGFDTTSYDILTFDSLPSTETRIILNTIKDNIFIDDLLLEYNNLFFASLRYVFAEQSYVDWAFKTSFLKAKHNVGDLEQSVNFKNDNLPSYEEYIKEVKPYKTKVREYLSSYEGLDNSQTVTTDFDLPARYVAADDSIQPLRVKASLDGIVVDNPEEVNTYPNRNWLDNAGYKVVRIELADAGKGYETPPTAIISGGGGTGATANVTLGRNGAISGIFVIDQGTGYLEAPIVTINGSVGPNGREAKAFSIIGDSPVRSLQTSIKFDRVSGTYEFVNLDTIETFVSSGKTFNFNLKWPMDLRTSKVSVFENGDEVLSRRYTYNNKLDTTKGYDRYFGQIEFVDPPANGSEIRIEYYKSINLLKAQDRINIEYEPTGDNFGKTLGQLMDGVDYGGVQVRSFEFGGTTGWNAAPWMSQGWDVFDTTFEDEIFRLDGSTIFVELSKPLEDGVEYNIYRTSYDINGQIVRNDRVDDPEYVGSPIADKPYVVMTPITGDGEQTIIDLADLGVSTIPEDSTEQTITIIVRKNTSDGSFIADPESFDTQLDGGNLVYSTATGLDSAEINIDGDGFVTQTTSKGPEEIVPGQVLDTLDIQVFEKPTGGASQITSTNYIGNGIKKEFDIGSTITQIENLFVKVDYIIKDKEDFVLDFTTNRLIFNVAPANNSKISIVNVGFSATSLLEIDSFTGNGTAIDFLTNARFEEDANVYATVDGVVADAVLIESDDTYERSGNFVLRFATPPVSGAVIQLLIAAGGIEVPQQYSKVTIDEIVADGSTVQYDLSQAPFEDQPEQSFVLVKVGNRILDPGYSQSFTVKGSQREYQLDLTQVPVASINSYDLKVYLNGIELEYLQTWTFEGAGSFDSSLDPQSQPGSTLTLTEGIGEDGDELKVFVVTSGEYALGYLDSANEFISTPKTIHFNEVFTENQTIQVYQFSNDKSQGIERQSFEVTEKTETTPGTELFYSFALLQKGYITLRKPAKDAQYTWVVKNGTMLKPNVDYIITSNKKYVKLAEQPVEGDKLQVIHFAETIVVDKFGWRQFKDMLNRTHYKRLQEVHHLAQPLNWYDKTIEVVDADNLPDPETDSKYPGVIFIEGERIEYFGRQNNTLLQLRRGTLGTGIKDVYEAGTMFMEQGPGATLPYKDETDRVSAISGGYNTGSEEYENSQGMNVTNIEYNFNNNTAFPVRVEGVYEQICTVTGEGFTDRVKVFVGETEATTRYISSTQLEFDVPGFNVPGAYDLIVVNPFTSIPIDTPQTSFVVPGGIKYVQILLPYAPIPNPASGKYWYRDSIPDEYWEAQDIEVFVAGRRLRKTYIDSYNYLDQDSPEGDTILEAEFAVNKNIGAYVRLTTPPPIGTTVDIFRNIGRTWSDSGESIAQSESNVAKFLRGKTTELPR
jgi:hypothetical protein